MFKSKNLMMKKTFLFIVIIPILNYSQLSPSVNELYNDLLKNDRYESSHIGFGGDESKVYNISQKINKLASDEEVEFIAYNGNVAAKAYAVNILFDRKSKQFLELFDYFRKNDQQIKGISGCVSYTSFLSEEMYRSAFAEKEVISRAEEFKKIKDSILNDKNLPQGFDKSILDEMKVETKWTYLEIDSLLLKMEKQILNDKNSSQSLVDLLCEYNLYVGNKKYYYDKLLYFNEKYNSEMIKQYLNYCK